MSFFFHCSLLFYGYSKSLCRHKRGTKRQSNSLYKKNPHYYNLESLIFKHSLLFIHTFKNSNLFFVSQSLTNAISLPLIYSISSKHVSDFSARNKKKLILPVQFSPPHRGKGQIPTLRRPCKSNSLLPGHRKWSNAQGLPGKGGC